MREGEASGLGEFLRSLLAIGVTIYFIPVAGWLLSRALYGERSPTVAMLNAMGIIWFVPLVLLLPAALLLRSRLSSLLLGTLLVAAFFLFPAEMRPTVGLSATGTPLRVMSHNVLASNEDGEILASIIEEEQPDIIALQELSPRMAEEINLVLAERYPHQLLVPWSDPRGIGLWSRYPLTALESFDLGLWENWAQIATVDVAGVPVTIANVHLWPIGTLDRAVFAQGLERQHGQAQQLKGWLETQSGPTLVVGDFNASPTNDTYLMVREAATDSWARTWGTGFTFPGQPVRFVEFPLLRIDYMWHKGPIAPRQIQVLDEAAGSDHLPLIADFVLTTPQ